MSCYEINIFFKNHRSPKVTFYGATDLEINDKRIKFRHVDGSISIFPWKSVSEINYKEEKENEKE